MLPYLSSQRGYIAETVIVFMILLAAILYPRDFQVKQATCMVGEEVKEAKTITMPVINEKNEPNGAGGPGTSDVLYRLIRTKVPVKMSPFFTNINPGGEAQGVQSHSVHFPDRGGDFYYPAQFGELDFYREFNANYNNTRTLDDKGTIRKDQFRFRFEGIIFSVLKNPDGTPMMFDDKTYLVDVYQEVANFENPDNDYEVEEIFRCTPERGKPAQVEIPAQNTAQSPEQLQLEWFNLKLQNFLDAHCKPAVYLYPKTNQPVNVKVEPKGYLAYVDPPYDKETGWIVWAETSGQLSVINNHLGKVYPYLYYESKILDEAFEKPEKGWVLRYEDLDTFYKDILPKLGLNKKEESDFSEYWKKALPRAPYYFVGIINQQTKDYIEPLTVTPNPDTSIRFSLYFERLEAPKAVTAPEIITPKRNGFTLVEWGGMVKNDPNHPFTCSQ